MTKTGWRMRTFLCLAVLVLSALSVVPALSATSHPAKGGHYSGVVTTTAGQTLTGETVTFTVSKDGKFVEQMRIKPYVITPCGAGGPPAKESSARASISSAGKFTATVVQKTATATFSGVFLKSGRESGTIKTKVKGLPACHGTYRYSTKVK